MPSFENIDTYGEAKGAILEIIQELGIDLKKYTHDEVLPLNHIFNVYNFLKRYAHSDRDFYRKGGKPIAEEAVLTVEAADKVLMVLRGKQALFSMHDPEIKQEAHAIIFTGERWSLVKRMHSLAAFLEAGYRVDTLFFLSINKDLDDTAQAFVQRHKDAFSGMKITYACPCASHFSHKEFLTMMRTMHTLFGKFYLISDPEYALTLNQVCADVAGSDYLGAFVRPIKVDPHEYIRLDLEGYKFGEFIPNPDDQKRAAAYSALNRFAYVIGQEVEAFKVLQVSPARRSLC